MTVPKCYDADRPDSCLAGPAVAGGRASQGRRWTTGSPCSVARRSAINERWHASGSRSTQKSADTPSGGMPSTIGVEIDAIEDLSGVALDVLGRELRARPLSDALPGVLAVLQPAELGGRRQLLVMAVLDAGLDQGGLQAHGIGPGVLATAHPTALANVEQLAHVRGAERFEEPICGEAVHPDRRGRPHGGILAIPAASR